MARRGSLAVVALLLAGAARADGPKPAEPVSPGAYEFALAKVLAGETEYRAALDAFAAAVQSEPRDPYVRLEFGTLLMRLGDTLRAEKQFEAAAALAPDNADVLKARARFELALAERKPDRWPIVVQRYQELAERLPEDVQTLSTLGQLHLNLSNPEAAATAFQRALALSPGAEFLVDFLVRALMETGRRNEASEVLADFLAGHPDQVEVRSRLVELQSEAGQHGEAADTLIATPVDLLDRSRELRSSLAFELFWSGRLDEALPVIERLRREEDSLDLGLLWSLTKAESGEPGGMEEGITAARALVEEEDGGAVVLSLARILGRAGRAGAALPIIASLVEELGPQPESMDVVQLRLLWASVAANQARWTDVLTALEPLADDEQDRVRQEARQLAGEALLRLERWADAVDMVEDDPGDGARAVRAEALLQLGRERAAEHELAPWVEGTDPVGWREAARIYQAVERYPDAIPLLERVAAEAPDPLASFWLGAAYERVARHEEAVAQFRLVIERQPDFHPALNYLGYMWAERGENLLEALELVERAVALAPENGAYLDSLGWIYFQLGELGPAREHLERAAALIPEDSTIQEHLGDLYRASGELDRARITYRRALDLGAEDARLVEKKLEGLFD